MRESYSVPMLAIKYKRLVLWDQPEYNHSALTTTSKVNMAETVQPKAYKEGTISPGAAKRLQKAIELLIDISPKQKIINPTTKREMQFQVNFFTLTLSAKQEHTDKEITTELLEKMLRWMRQVYGMKSYIWKAERQKNGNLHYHITTNVFIHWRNIRDKWNDLQSSLGYIDKFAIQNGHRDPNSTDVHSVREVQDLARYLVKYVCKKGLKVDCKSWDCSKNLKRKDTVKFEVDSMVVKELDSLYENTEIEVIKTDHCWIVYQKGKDIRKLLPEKWKRDYYGYLNDVAGYNLYRGNPYGQEKKIIEVKQEIIQRTRSAKNTQLKINML